MLYMVIRHQNVDILLYICCVYCLSNFFTFMAETRFESIVTQVKTWVLILEGSIPKSRKNTLILNTYYFRGKVRQKLNN